MQRGRGFGALDVDVQWRLSGRSGLAPEQPSSGSGPAPEQPSDGGVDLERRRVGLLPVHLPRHGRQRARRLEAVRPLRGVQVRSTPYRGGRAAGVLLELVRFIWSNHAAAGAARRPAHRRPGPAEQGRPAHRLRRGSAYYSVDVDEQCALQSEYRGAMCILSTGEQCACVRR